ILPGEKLHCENLKHQLDVGMSPIREALAKLTATNLVTFEEHKGYSVKKMNAEELSDNILTFAEIECLCFRLAIEHGDDEWEGNIISALHCLKKIESGRKVDYSVWAPLNEKFHNALVSACPLHPLIQIRNEFYKRHQWYVRLSYKSVDSATIQANYREHKQLADLAIKKNQEKAVEMLMEHITSGKDPLIAQLSTQGMLNGSS
nr:hypothetical protein [Chlamydiota bacterium]